MRGELMNRDNLRTYGNIISMNLDHFRAIHHCFASGPRRLKSNKDNHIPVVRGKCFQMMKNASTGGHSARGNDNHRPLPGIEALRFLPAFDKLRGMIHFPALGGRQPVLLLMIGVDFGGFYGHRAIKVDRNIGNSPGGLEEMNRVKNRLCAANGKRRNQDNPPSLEGAINTFSQYYFRIRRIVKTIPVSRLYNQVISPADRRWWVHNQAVRSSQFTRKKNGG